MRATSLAYDPAYNGPEEAATERSRIPGRLRSSATQSAMSDSSGKPVRLALFLVSSDPAMAALFSRFSLALAASIGASIASVSELRAGRRLKDIVREFSGAPLIDVKSYLWAVIARVGWIARSLLRIRTGADLSRLVFEGARIGPHLYDSMLRRDAIPSLGVLSFRQKMILGVELAYVLAAWEAVKRLVPDVIVLPDNTYRQGALFEILVTNWRGTLYAGLDMNCLAAHRYTCPVQHLQHCRAPSVGLVERIANDAALILRANAYMAIRKQGEHAQHDVIRAFDPAKLGIDRARLVEKFGIFQGRKIVLVMAHIFTDAPHAYPGTLYQDYEAWLVETCTQLARNEAVHVLVKEHPSSALYGEEGVIERILDGLSMRHALLDKNINTASLFDCVDCIVTCGGTAAMEFAAHGVPVVVACRPPYAHLGFCRVASSVEEYRALLARAHELVPLGQGDRTRALISLYSINSLYGVDRAKAGIGTQAIYKGAPYSEDQFFRELRASGPGTPEFSYLTRALGAFSGSDERNLIAGLN